MLRILDLPCYALATTDCVTALQISRSIRLRGLDLFGPEDEVYVFTSRRAGKGDEREGMPEGATPPNTMHLSGRLTVDFHLKTIHSSRV